MADGKRLVRAIEEDAKVDILHACGGNARCTTCRIEFIDGEPERQTVAERDRLAARGLSGVRLSCQILCDHDMTVRAISDDEGSGRPDSGGQPDTSIDAAAGMGRGGATPRERQRIPSDRPPRQSRAARTIRNGTRSQDRHARPRCR